MFPPRCCDKILRDPVSCTEMFLITLYLHMERNMVPFSQLLLYTCHARARTHARVLTHTHTRINISIHPSGILHVCVGVTVYAVSISQWILRGGQLCKPDCLFRLKTWELGKSLERGKSQEEESFTLEWLPKRNWVSVTAETLASYLCRWAWNTACTNPCTVQTHGHTNTSIHPYRRGVGWAGQ